MLLLDARQQKIIHLTAQAITRLSLSALANEPFARAHAGHSIRISLSSLPESACHRTFLLLAALAFGSLPPLRKSGSD